MTPDEIKKLEEINLGENELVLGEIQSIIAAADKDAFWMIGYAYTLGFTRGLQAAKGDSEKKQVGISEQPKPLDLWDISNAADDVGIELERIQYMLQILNENLEDEISFLKKADSGHAQHFVSRYDIHRAQLEMVELWLIKTRGELAEIPKEIRKIHKGQADT